jgi:hypothetical protein
MRARLEEATRKIIAEIERDGSVTAFGHTYRPNSLRNDSPLAGLCHGAVARLIEECSDLDFTVLSFEISREKLFEGGRHTIARVGEYDIDPTIGQYIPGAKTIYESHETYPLTIVAGSLKEISGRRFITGQE